MAFQKRNIGLSVPNCSILSAKYAHGSWKTSSGVPSLDKYIGDGLTVGSLTVIIEDSTAYLARLFAESFLHEGQKNGHQNLYASLNRRKLEMQSRPTNEALPKDKDNASDEESLTIAWRYKNLPKYTDSAPAPDEKRKQVELSEVEIWSGDEMVDGVTRASYPALLEDIYRKTRDFQIKPGDVGEKNVLRMALVSLGTSLWEEGSLLRFLVLLKALLRRTYSVAVVTIPAFVIKKPSFTISRLRNLSDIFVTLTSIDPGVHEELKQYSAVTSIEFPNTLNAFHINYPDTKDLALKISRNQIVVEKVHLTPGIREDEKKPVSRVDF